MSRRRLPVGVRRRVWPSGTVTYEASWFDASGQRHTENYDTAAEADAARQERLRERRRGRSGDPSGGRVTVAEWHERWSSTRRVRATTLEREASIWRLYIAPVLGSLRLGDLRRSDVAAWVAGLESEGLAPATIVRSLGVLSKLLDDAVTEELVDVNPAAKVRAPEVPVSEQRFLDADELRRLEAATPEHWRLVVPFAAATGLRIGEIAALRVRDIDVPSRSVTVRATVVDVSGDGPRRRVHPPKTRAGARTVPSITDPLAERLVAHIAGRGLAYDDWLFTGPEGGPMTPRNWRERVWRPSVERAHLAPPAPTPHALRHTAVAAWVAVGADLYTVSRWAGHSSVAFTTRVYGHLWKLDYSGTRAALADILAGKAEVVPITTPARRVAVFGPQ
ncbi:MAG: tyrosine-type recombinase/integrase [Acidimicrobiales bacterium]